MAKRSVLSRLADSLGIGRCISRRLEMLPWSMDIFWNLNAQGRWCADLHHKPSFGYVLVFGIFDETFILPRSLLSNAGKTETAKANAICSSDSDRSRSKQVQGLGERIEKVPRPSLLDLEFHRSRQKKIRIQRLRRPGGEAMLHDTIRTILMRCVRRSSTS